MISLEQDFDRALHEHYALLLWQHSFLEGIKLSWAQNSWIPTYSKRLGDLQMIKRRYYCWLMKGTSLSRASNIRTALSDTGVSILWEASSLLPTTAVLSVIFGHREPLSQPRKDGGWTTLALFRSAQHSSGADFLTLGTDRSSQPNSASARLIHFLSFLHFALPGNLNHRVLDHTAQIMITPSEHQLFIVPKLQPSSTDS